MAKFTEPPHRHSDACWSTDLSCGVAPHEHGAACYVRDVDRRPLLRCGQREHAHSSACYRRSLTCGGDA